MMMEAEDEIVSACQCHSDKLSHGTTMIVDEKNIATPPPPSYHSSVEIAGPPPFHHPRIFTTLQSIPAHILLQIVYSTFSQHAFVQSHRKTLYWLAISLRLVNRALYVASMHVLRSTYLPAYDLLIRPPYSSDPFPLLSPSPPSPSPSQSPYGPSSSTSSLSTLQTIQRETTTLDLFIALKVREDVWVDDSELHLERDESFKDLFDLVQPRSRLEDLVRIYGIRQGVITLKSKSATRSTPTLRTPPPPHPIPPSPSPSSSGFFSVISSSFASSSKSKPRQSVPITQPPPPQQPTFSPIPFNLISISFSPRKVGIVLSHNKRTIVQTQRTKEEKLESAAKRLVKELKVWLAESA